MPQIPVKVLRKKQETQDIASFELARPDGSPLPAFSAGSHIDVQVPGGPVRQYSLCNDAAEQHRYRIAVLRDANSRDGSAAMHDALINSVSPSFTWSCMATEPPREAGSRSTAMR